MFLTKAAHAVDRPLIPGGGDTPYNGLYGEAPPKRGTFLQASGI